MPRPIPPIPISCPRTRYFIAGSECVRLLIEAGAKIDSKGSFENDMLLYAARLSSVEIFKMLVDAGAQIDAPSGSEKKYAAA